MQDPTTTKKPRKKQTKTPARIGKKGVTVWLDQEDYDQLKTEAERWTTLDAMCVARLTTRWVMPDMDDLDDEQLDELYRDVLSELSKRQAAKPKKKAAR